MHVKLVDQSFFLLRVCHLEADELLLKLIWNSCQDAVTSALSMLRLALLTVEFAVDLANELELISTTFRAVKLSWVK